MSKSPAPIALFVYNRLDHTRRTVEALAKNQLAKESDLFIFSDAAKDKAGTVRVTQIRDYIKNISGFRSVTIVERPENWGLAHSITSGVTELVEKFDRVIVLEDDLVTSPHFLSFMNDGLELYADTDTVAEIHGYVYPVDGLPETFFIKGADCWGWATWKRAWKYYEPDGVKLLTELKKRRLTREFDFDGNYPYTMMLENQIMKVNDSWAVRWYASCFLAGKLTLYPGRSLVVNIGMDDSGENSTGTKIYEVSLSPAPVAIIRATPTEDLLAKEKFAQFLATTGTGRTVIQLKFLVKKLLFNLRKFFS
ncbi:MAG: glycosyltransferase [Candidatus Vogelbacteria bacterium]|nr:glycosyltransferase [Candidatus Vogelbacteria bacterium]